MRLAQQIQREGIGLAGRVAPRAIGAKLAGAMAIENALGHDRARRVAGAEEEDVQRFRMLHGLHLLLPASWSSTRSQSWNSTQQVRSRSAACRHWVCRSSNPRPGKREARASPPN